MSQGRVLVIDDEEDLLESCRRLLTWAGHDVQTLSDPTLLHPAMSEFGPDVLLLDLRMPRADGMTVLAAALASDPLMPVIIMTAFGSVASAVVAIREGAFDYITKPFSREQLGAAVERALRYRGLQIENRTLRQQAGDDPAVIAVVGQSPALIQALTQLRQAAPSDASVLLLGESGTGKELFARCVHELSPRRHKPFVPVDCASLPENLLESELFGHERGAFTGAVARKQGLLLDAAGGTVFLDEIGELGQSTQAKLLRVLEERSLRPVGGNTLVPADFRLVVATNLDVKAAVEDLRFRADLFFRINVIQIQVPPLRARTGDMRVLLERFLHEFSRGTGRPVPRVSPEAMTALEAYSWPGNIRELRNLAQRLVVLDGDGRVTLSDLPEAIRGWPEDGAPVTGAPPSYEVARDLAMQEFLRGYTRRLLEYHGGSVSRAAQAAGVTRRTVHRWLAGVEERPESR